MKRYLGLDLGTKTLGVSITDRSNTIIFPYTLIRFNHEDYETAFLELKEIIVKEGITEWKYSYTFFLSDYGNGKLPSKPIC